MWVQGKQGTCQSYQGTIEDGDTLAWAAWGSLSKLEQEAIGGIANQQQKEKHQSHP